MPVGNQQVANAPAGQQRPTLADAVTELNRLMQAQGQQHLAAMQQAIGDLRDVAISIRELVDERLPLPPLPPAGEQPAAGTPSAE